MGSLTSKPKAPKPSPQVVYVPATPAPVVTPPVTPTPDPEEEAATARKSSLLARDRGRFGTVLTSFRGFLGQKESDIKRKTLLGE